MQMEGERRREGVSKRKGREWKERRGLAKGKIEVGSR